MQKVLTKMQNEPIQYSFNFVTIMASGESLSLSQCHESFRYFLGSYREQKKTAKSKSLNKNKSNLNKFKLKQRKEEKKYIKENNTNKQTNKQTNKDYM